MGDKISIEFEAGLDFYDVSEYIPNLTIDNNVHSDGDIHRFTVFKGINEIVNLFYDFKTKDFVYQADCKHAQIAENLGYEIIDFHKKSKAENQFMKSLWYFIENKQRFII
jgi:hypothetical protein